MATQASGTNMGSESEFRGREELYEWREIIINNGKELRKKERKVRG